MDGLEATSLIIQYKKNGLIDANLKIIIMTAFTENISK